MMEGMAEALLRQYDFVLGVSLFLHRRSGKIAQYKAEIQLSDGTRLHVNEVWIDEELRKYAYYHLSPTNRVIRGWDNAPHHPEVSTFPHHCHHGDQIEPSSIRSLNDVLNFLSGRLGANAY